MAFISLPVPTRSAVFQRRFREFNRILQMEASRLRMPPLRPGCKTEAAAMLAFGAQLPTSWRKIVLDRRQRPILAGSFADPARSASASQPDLRIKRPRRIVQQLLLPGVDLVRMNLVALRQVVHCRLFRATPRARASRSAPRQSSVVSSSCSAPFNAFRSRLRPTKPVVLKSGATSRVYDRATSIVEIVAQRLV